MKLYLFTLLVLLTPVAAADTADIPALSGSGIERFVAGWYASDGATVPAGATQFMALYGFVSPRNAETDVVAQATFYYNVTNFRVSASTANCGGLGIGQSFTFALRLNAADTALTGSCVNGAAANSFTLDTDIVAIAPGDRLTMRVTQIGAVLGVALRVGITLEGFKTVNITTEPVVDMVNEMLETFYVVAPFLTLFGLIVWAEQSKELLIYIVAIIAGSIAVATQATELNALRIVEVAILLLLVIRAFFVYEDTKGEVEENEG